MTNEERRFKEKEGGENREIKKRKKKEKKKEKYVQGERKEIKGENKRSQ